MNTLPWSSRQLGAIFMLALPLLALPTAARSEEARAGVVTKLVGTATVARATLPEPAALRFKDDVLLKDRITTGESSAVRVLLGGKATITARERSVITITEIPGTATVGIVTGRAAIAVAKDKMKSGELVEIRTPNAVVAVRGTVVIAEVEPVVGGHRSTITILKGLVDVTKLDGAGRLTGPSVDVKMLERIVVTSKPLAAPEKITKQAGEGLAAQFSFVPQNGPAASTEALTAQVKEAAVDDAMRAVGMAPDPRTMSASSSAVASDAPGPVAPRDSGPEVLGGTPTNPVVNPAGVGGAVTGTTTTVANTTASAPTGAVGNTVTGVTTAVTNTVTNTVSTVTTTVSTVTSAVPVVSNTVSTVVPVVTNTVNTVVPTVTNTVSTVVPVVTNTVNTVVPTVTNVVTTVAPPLAPVVVPVVNIVTPVVNTVTTTLTTVTSPAAPTVPSTGGLLSGLGLGKK